MKNLKVRIYSHVEEWETRKNSVFGKSLNIGGESFDCINTLFDLLATAHEVRGWVLVKRNSEHAPFGSDRWTTYLVPGSEALDFRKHIEKVKTSWEKTKEEMATKYGGNGPEFKETLDSLFVLTIEIELTDEALEAPDPHHFEEPKWT